VAIAKQLIRMDEGRGLLVEVEVDTAQAVQAASRGEIWDVQKGFDAISDFLHRVMEPFSATWHKLSEEVSMHEATIKLAVGVTAGGNFFLAKGQGSANFEVQLKFTPAEPDGK
jgi:hypothetical protein